MTFPLWIAFTLTASAAQTFRNAMQRDLTGSIGTLGATCVRFVFGLPFALLFLALAAAVTGFAVPRPSGVALAWILVGAMAQILATGLMLAAMRERSFVAAIAYTKTEPVQVALFGLVFLGDRLGWMLALAIALATAGVMLMSWPKAQAQASWKPVALGLVSATFFAFSATGFRGGILTLATPSFVMASSTTLVLGLAMQSALILAGLAAFDRPLLRAMLQNWRPSLLAGFLGAFASQFWFLAFALATAAQVRTLALVEVIFAQIVSRKLFSEGVGARELCGVALIAAGVAVLLNA